MDDEPGILQMLRFSARSMMDVWEPAFVESAQQALELMARQPFEVIVSDMRMPGLTGAQLLNEVMRRYPATIRLILSGYADEEMALKCICATHQFLSKPCAMPELKATLNRICRLKERVQSEEIRNLILRKNRLPSVPSVYFKMLEVLQNQDCPTQRIAEIVATDPGLTAKLLQLVNSAFFGYAHNVSNVGDAVMLLGVGMIRSLALSFHLFSAFDHLEFGECSVEKIWNHSLRVGQLARLLAECEGANETVIDQAFTAGLLHDSGKLILADTLANLYGEIMAQARRQKRPLPEIESERLQANHADVGAYLMDLWGLPTALVEAVALHHEPRHSNPAAFSPLTAVHVANVLASELDANLAAVEASQLDMEYLGELGLNDRVEQWRKALGISRPPAKAAGPVLVHN